MAFFSSYFTKTTHLVMLCVIVLATLVLATLQHGSCDDPRPFYTQDYAARPEMHGTPIEGIDLPNIKPQPSPFTNGGNYAPPRVSTSGRATSQDSAQSRKILGIVYVNSLSAEHLHEVLAEVFRLYDERIVFFYSVYHLGSYRTVSTELQLECAKRNIRIEQVSDVPPVLGEVSSPTWLLKMKEGTHIIDGFISLKTLINEWGEVRIGKKPDAKKTAIATEKVGNEEVVAP